MLAEALISKSAAQGATSARRRRSLEPEARARPGAHLGPLARRSGAARYRRICLSFEPVRCAKGIENMPGPTRSAVLTTCGHHATKCAAFAQ
jgi:hypothetical protein